MANCRARHDRGHLWSETSKSMPGGCSRWIGMTYRPTFAMGSVGAFASTYDASASCNEVRASPRSPGLRISIARFSFQGRNRSGLRIRNRTQFIAARAGCIFIRRWRAFDAEKGISVPVGTGDSVGDCRERLIDPPVPFESFVQSCDLMGGVLPLSAHLRAGLNAAAAEQCVRITISNGVGDFPQPTLYCHR